MANFCKGLLILDVMKHVLIDGVIRTSIVCGEFAVHSLMFTSGMQSTNFSPNKSSSS
jgi:hypothetical protein